jgi:hypothetical protein
MGTIQYFTKASMLTLSGEGLSAFALLSSQFITPGKKKRGLNTNM